VTEAVFPVDAESWSDFFRRTLVDDVVPFWFPRAVDREFGGYLHAFDRDGTLVDSDKSVWAQGRMAWMLLTMHQQLEPRPEWLDWGLHGVEFLLRHGFDDDGRMFFQLARDGSPLRKRRYAYSESFAAIALAVAAKATGIRTFADQARKCFQHFVNWNFTPGLMPAKFTGVRPMESIGPRMITIVTAQELRLNLGPDPLWESWIDRCVDDIDRLFVNRDRLVVLENVAPDGSLVDHFDGRILNPGHSIEAAWFLMEEGQQRYDSRLTDLGLEMLELSWARGWDQEHGGLFYFRDIDDRPVQEYWHDMKFWWPHNEAMIATLKAWSLTGRDKYRDWFRDVSEWSFRHFAEPEYGEWYGYLHRDGRISTTLKGNMWKSFFHHPRMLLKCHQIAEATRSDSKSQ
jgi:N-acylglucosamine 2-epimerase